MFFQNKQNYIISMSKYMRSISEGTFTNRASQDSVNMLKNTRNLISLTKDIYNVFNEFELTKSRLWPIKEYQYLVEEIRVFNSQLREWKENKGPEIKNLRMAYHFYENLYSRILGINSLSFDQQSAKRFIVRIIKWYDEQKPKMRGIASGKPEAILKPSKADLLEEMELHDITQYTMRKREMKPYEKMTRTVHTNFFPPKQRLLDYHKKQYVLDGKLTINNDQLREARQAQTSSFRLGSSTDRKLMRETSTTFGNTKTTFRNTTVSAFNSNTHKKLSTAQIKQVKQSQNEKNQQSVQIKQFTIHDNEMINDQGIDKIVQKEDMLNNLINEPNYEEDENDEQNYLEEVPEKSKYRKAYQTDHKLEQQKDTIHAAEQIIKDPKQSTLRRLLQSNAINLQQKLEDLDIKRNICNWAKTASFQHQQLSRKTQSYRHANQFQKTQFKKKGFFEKRKEIPLFELHSQRAKTAQQKIKTIEQTYQNRKLDSTLKSFGKYINAHVKINPMSHEAQYNQEMRIMRATSLTSFNKKPKRKNFGDILAANSADRYNQKVQSEICHLKDRLSKKLVGVNKKKIHSALTAVKIDRLEEESIFPRTLNLFSNPFFPKHLYETKKKKKK